MVQVCTAALVDEVVLVKPGSDGALALGMLHVLISAGLVDRAFIAEHVDTAGFAALNARNKTNAALRSAPSRYLLRLDIANPSASRWIGHTTTSSGMFKSFTICRITAVCWASF